MILDSETKSKISVTDYPVYKHESRPPINYVEPARPKRGDLKKMDAFEQDIIENAQYYTVTLFRHRSSTRSYANFDCIEKCKQWSLDVLSEKDTPYRAAMTYAIDHRKHFALICTLRRGDTEFRYPEIKYY